MSRLAAGILLLLLALGGCAAFSRSATNQFADELTTAILDQNDVATVRDGAPAYLIAIDGLIEGDPENRSLLLTGAALYGTYATTFVEDEARAGRLSQRALGYGRRAFCTLGRVLCQAVDRPYDEFEASLGTAGRGDVPVLYGFGAAWAGWVQTHADDWGAIAELPKIEALMRRVVELDEAHEHGAAHIALGVLLTQRPASLGGEPERAREHFERGIALSEGHNQMAKVFYAEYYARLVFDRPLHDRLLQEVEAADPEIPGFTLSNTLARERARRLLDDADDYF